MSEINQHIKELVVASRLLSVDRAGRLWTPWPYDTDLTLFVEVLANLIVLESCIVIRKNNTAKTKHDYADLIKKHFGVQ